MRALVPGSGCVRACPTATPTPHVLPAAAAQELLASLSGMDWDTIASFDWGEQMLAGTDCPAAATAEGPADAAGAGAAGGGAASAAPGPVLPDWSRLLSLSPSDWAAALQDLHSQQQQPQPAAAPLSQQQQGGTAAPPSGRRSSSPDAELQQEISLMPQQLPPLRQEQQQPSPPPPPAGAAQPRQPPARHKRTHSKISPISSGLEGMKLGRGGTPP